MSSDPSVSEILLLKDVTTGALYASVYSYSWISFISNKMVAGTNVLCIVSLLSSWSAMNVRPAAAWLYCGSDPAVVVGLEEKDHHLNDEHSKAEEYTMADAQQAICCKINMICNSQWSVQTRGIKTSDNRGWMLVWVYVDGDASKIWTANKMIETVR